MANKKVRFTATIQDISNNKSAVNSYALIPEAATLTTMQTAFSAWYDAVAAVTDGNTLGGHYTVLASDAAIGGVGFDDSWLGRSAVLNYNFGIPALAWGQAIPAIADSVVDSGVLDLTDPLITALTGVMLGAVLGGNYTDNTWNTGGLTSLRDGFLANRKRNSGRTKSHP
jgi:hypothetical protein